MGIKFFDRLDSLRLRRRPIYEAAETNIVKREVSAGDTFVDIGAHIGYYTLLASSLVGNAGVVFAFEPDPENFSVLKKNVEAAACRNVFLVNEAVSIKTGVADLYLNPKNSGDNRLFYPGTPWPKVRIKTTRLDEFFESYSGRIAFIKCDAQGHELSILYGMNNLLRRLRSVKLLMEYFPVGIKQNGDDPIRFLAEIKVLGFMIKFPTPEIIDRCTPENGKHCNLFLKRET